MAAPSTLRLDHFTAREGERPQLRFSTAGSVDDGKSTLIGRMLFDSKGAFDDQIEALKKSPINRSSGAIDFSLLTDGLKAEREQGITIDVAWRHFKTPRRQFLIADTPGHEQYTRNMATGASACDAAVILVDARKGVLPQSRRHATIASLLGIRHLVVAINKMDLVEYSVEVFEQIRAEFAALSARLGDPSMTFIPVSALEGDNVAWRSTKTPWYEGPTLLEHLETLDAADLPADAGFRFPVQLVVRPHLDFRGFAGRIEAGRIGVGDAVTALPSGRSSRVRSISTFDGQLEEAFAPMSVVVSLDHEIDISRGDVLVTASGLPTVARRVEARLVWMDHAALEVNRTYLLQHGPHQTPARITTLVSKLDIETLTSIPAESLDLNEIGLAVIETAQPLAFDPYRTNRRTGSFILIDPASNLTVAAGMIERQRESRLKKKTGLQFRSGQLTPAERAEKWGHGSGLVLLEGREATAYALEQLLSERHAHTVVLTRTVTPLDALLDAGLIVISTAPVSATSAPAADSRVESLPEDPDEAAAELVELLEARGVLRSTDEFTQGEGI
jgi:sulfate adenylyltransferase subunit 1